MKFTFAMALPLLLTGCPLNTQSPTDPGLVEAQKNALSRPPNRFQVAGKREYNNGTEIYVLDGESGQVCYFFIASGKGGADSQKTDMRACAGEALSPAL